MSKQIDAMLQRFYIIFFFIQCITKIGCYHRKPGRNIKKYWKILIVDVRIFSHEFEIMQIFTVEQQSALRNCRIDSPLAFGSVLVFVLSTW